ncbi:MAG: efflux RND transporter periplasmic adaptor subunit [Planctomycetes bacterium]|nr:efflux RND transporter periplasmic adaptor subunit [Planctomycetota bacterium]
MNREPSTFQMCALVVTALAVLISGGVCLAEGVEAITRPSKDVTLSFVRPGQIKEVLVEEGDVVKANQALVRQDDAAEQAQLAQIKAQAVDTTYIEAATAKLAQSRVDLQKLDDAQKRSSGAVTAMELEHARLDVVIAQLSVALEKFKRRQNHLKYSEAKIRVLQMTILSPIDGTVESLDVEVGEAVDALADVVRVVCIDPLRVDAPVPLAQARLLRPGQKARIKFAAGVPEASSASDGKIVSIASVADAASSTLMVRIEMPNPTGRPAGEYVSVDFPYPPPKEPPVIKLKPLAPKKKAHGTVRKPKPPVKPPAITTRKKASSAVKAVGKPKQPTSRHIAKKATSRPAVKKSATKPK